MCVGGGRGSVTSVREHGGVRDQREEGLKNGIETTLL